MSTNAQQTYQRAKAEHQRATGMHPLSDPVLVMPHKEGMKRKGDQRKVHFYMGQAIYPRAPDMAGCLWEARLEGVGWIKADTLAGMKQFVKSTLAKQRAL